MRSNSYAAVPVEAANQRAKEAGFQVQVLQASVTRAALF